MTAVLLWKEYRQQRLFWLAIALLAVLLVLSLGTLLGHGQGTQVFQEKDVKDTLITLIFILATSYGVVSGALVLAGEHDDGTWVFLDSLTGQRGPLWYRKCLAGVLLTLAQSLALVVLSSVLGFVPWFVAVLVPVLALDAFSWGLLGGAVGRRVLSAVLIGIGYMALSWLVLLVLGNYLLLLGIARAGAASLAVYLSWRGYTAVDRARLAGGQQTNKRQRTLVPASVRVLLWLIVRQGRWTLVGCGLATLVLIGTVNLVPLLVWPVATTLLGAVCGLSTFIDDQNDGVRFLGAQRFPPGRIWMVKVGFWGLLLIVLTTIAWLGSILVLILLHPETHLFQRAGHGNGWLGKWLSQDSRSDLLNPWIFMLMWPMYGFAIGHYFSQVMPRAILASILGIFMSSLVAIWIPSFLLGGLSLWQVLVVPVLLLLLTRLNQWAWLSSRLLSGRPLLMLCAGNFLVVLGLASVISYRVFEIPDVGEPFDVAEYTASLPTPEQNEAGRLMRRASLHLRDQCTEVENHLPAPTRPIFPDDKVADGLPRGPALPPLPANGLDQKYTYQRLESDLLDHGWPDHDADVVSWLDGIFTGPWVAEAEKATELPLGMIQDPRNSDGLSNGGNTELDCRNLALFFQLRAIQRQGHGEWRGALKHIEVALALTRQLKHHAMGGPYNVARSIENGILVTYRRWLQNAPPDKELLREALALLQHHEAANPTARDAIKATYVNYRQNDPVFTGPTESVNQILGMSFQVPWEKERQHRLLRAAISGLLHAEEIAPSRFSNENARLAGRLGLPTRDGPGAQLKVAAWGRLMHQLVVDQPRVLPLQHMRDQLALKLHAAEVATAVALYQIDKGTPDNLEVLIPDYLASLPTDPETGKTVDYRISEGETIESGNSRTWLQPGQAIVYVDRSGSLIYFPVPYWKK
jgi:hypothetical protein